MKYKTIPATQEPSPSITPSLGEQNTNISSTKPSK
jgi:hypothetical protein